MAKTLKKTGHCLCKAVKYSVMLDSPHVHVCHCNFCQKWGGGPALAVCCNSDWQFEGEENLTWYDSSEWAKRGFCKICGSHLAFKTNDGSYHGVTAGSLDTQEELSIDSHIFIDKKPDYFDFTDKSPRLTEEEFYKQFENKE